MGKQCDNTFPFFELPGEIRDQILCYYAGNKYVKTYERKPPPKKPRKKKDKQGKPHAQQVSRQNKFDGTSMYTDREWGYHDRVLDLLDTFRVSHQFYHEATTAFYSSSEFIIRDELLPFLRLVRSLSISYQNCIRELNITITYNEAEDLRKAFKENAKSNFSGLRNVHIGIEVLPSQWVWDDDVTLRVHSSKSLPRLQLATILVHSMVFDWDKRFCICTPADLLAESMAEALR